MEVVVLVWLDVEVTASCVSPCLGGEDRVSCASDIGLQSGISCLPGAGSGGCDGVARAKLVVEGLTRARSTVGFAVEVVVSSDGGSVGSGVVGDIRCRKNKCLTFKIACASNHGGGGGRCVRCRRVGGRGGLEKSRFSWEDWLLDLEVDERIGLWSRYTWDCERME